MNDAEENLLECWAILRTMRTKPSDRLIEFQPLLAEVLYTLADIHTDIGKERQRLIHQKKRYSTLWFRRRQSSLASYQDAIKQTIAVGRSLGDAFAWFFYQNDPSLLRQHYAEQHQRLPPAGLGGRGELETIRNVRQLGGKFVLHHNITSILRLGDVSLIDLAGLRVVGVGELKTTKSDELALDIHLEVLIRTDSAPPREHSPDARSEPAKGYFPEAMQSRLNRQLQRIRRLLKKVETNRKDVLLGGETHVRRLGRFLSNVKTGTLSYQQLDSGLLVGAYRVPGRSLLTRLTADSAKLPMGMDEIPGRAMELLVPDAPYNSLTLSSVHYATKDELHTTPGAPPLFWWGLPENQARDIIFHKLRVMTVYNPAPVLRELERQGFEIKVHGNPVGLQIRREHKDETATFHNFWYFLELVPLYMYTEAQVVRIIAMFSARAGELPDSRSRTINLILSLHPFKPPPNLSDLEELE